MVNVTNNGLRFSEGLTSLVFNIANTGRGNKQLVSALLDGLVVATALWLAYTLRFGYFYTGFGASWFLFLLMPLITVSLFAGLGIYRWVVRSSNMRLLYQLAKGCIGSALVLLIAMNLFPPNETNPRSLFVIYGLLLLTGTCGLRILWQMMFTSGIRGEPVAIYGAGSAGRQLMRLLAVGKEYRPVAFIDDDQNMVKSTVAGLPVVDGKLEHLGTALKRLDVSLVILAIPSVSNLEYQKKIARLEELGLPIQTIPTVSEVVAGHAAPSQIRDVSIADILGRTEVSPDMSLMGKCVTGKVVLVTGGGGSIGSELCRQIFCLNARKLVVCDHSEANLYQITEELLALGDKHGFSSECFVPVLCSVTDKVGIDRVIREQKVDTVYHAAAYKHVPIVEAQPEQGVFVNVFGTKTVLESAIEHKVANFVLISTDKAVRPTNSMGASKRTAELVLQAKASTNSETCISMVRFGNVLGSSGSVVPKFMKQIREGSPITLTHKDITRFFMTIPEAAQLVLQASGIARGGDVFVLDMGEPVRIYDLAETMVRLCGKKLKKDTGNSKDVEIKLSGLRPGEKMYEELFINNDHHASKVKKVFTANETWIEWEVLKGRLDAIRQLAESADRSALRGALLDLACSGEISESVRHAGAKGPLLVSACP
ncbi:MAG: nucleoside-diphosphate sugar epimerase/dehydratase [Granulosicoccus sp.]